MADKMERFTQRARRALSLAHEEAERLHHNYMGTEHLLLGLIREEAGIASRVLRDLGVTIPQAREIVERLTGVGLNPSSRIELAPETEQALQRGIEEARRWGHHYIGTEHLLLGMVLLGEGVGMKVLSQLGITLKQIQRQTRRALQESPTRHTGRPSQPKITLKETYVDRLTRTLESALEDKRNELSKRITDELAELPERITKVIRNLEHV